MASKKPAPDRIPRSLPKAIGVDCFSIRLQHGEDEKEMYLFSKIEGETVFVRSWQNGAFSKESELAFNEISGFKFISDRFLGPYEFQYNKPLKQLLWEWLRIPQILITKEKIAQLIFNTKTPARTDRIELLKWFVEYRRQQGFESGFLGKNDGAISTIGSIGLIHGRRIISHPLYKETNVNFILNAESLVESGDLKEIDGSYIATGKALSTIANFEQENRRHRDQILVSRILAFLTAALVIVGLIQVWINYHT